MKKSTTKAAKRARAARAAKRAADEKHWAEQRAADERRNREIEEEAERTLRRQIEGPCPRCSHTPLVVYHNHLAMEPGVGRYDLVVSELTHHGTSLAIAPVSVGRLEAVEWTRSVDALIYCPHCGALHEIGGETNYPQSGKTGLPQEDEARDITTSEDVIRQQAETANHIRKLFEGL
jgi:hypothetical protein